MSNFKNPPAIAEIRRLQASVREAHVVTFLHIVPFSFGPTRHQFTPA